MYFLSFNVILLFTHSGHVPSHLHYKPSHVCWQPLLSTQILLKFKHLWTSNMMTHTHMDLLWAFFFFPNFNCDRWKLENKLSTSVRSAILFFFNMKHNEKNISKHLMCCCYQHSTFVLLLDVDFFLFCVERCFVKNQTCECNKGP